MPKIKTESDENYKTLCRICGMFSNEILDIFITDRNGKKLVEILSFCLKQTIYQDDGLPEVICLNCEANLIMVYEFHTLTASVQKAVELKLKVRNNTCRLCGNFSYCILDLFKSQHNGKQLIQMLSFCLNQIVHEDDGSPRIICLVCQPNLIKVYEFHKLYFESKQRQILAISVDEMTKKTVEVVYEPAGEDEIKVEDDVFLPARPPLDVTNSNLVRKPIKMYSKQKKKAICHICSKECKNTTYLKYHVESTHNETYLVCHFENCNSTHKTKSSLKYHVQKHSGETYNCDICDKSFFRSADLSRHIRIHSTEKPHVCSICAKAFKDKSTLSKHMKTHNGEKTHICKFCDRPFLVRSSLLIHERIHTGEKPYICNVCSKSFSHVGGLASHRRTHTGEKPYSCNVCHISFKQQTHLKQHERVHTRERPYECKVCQSKFLQIGHLITHKKIHTRTPQPPTHDKIRSVGMQFSCAHCGKLYSRKTTLKSHLSKCFKEHGFENRFSDHLNQRNVVKRTCRQR